MDQALFYTLFAFLLFPRKAYLSYYPTVFWSPNNCKFKLNNETDEGYFFKVKAMSSMIFMCPHFALWLGKTDNRPQRKMVNENILVVDEESYKTCSIKNGTQFRKLLTCDSDPMSNMKYTEEIFSKVQAHEDKMCYVMGKHYYFISTSDGSAKSLSNTEGGHCKSHHMKLHIYVCNETDKCEYEVADCPKDKVQNNNETIATTESRPRNCTNDLSVSAQTGVKGWFSDNRHPILYALMGLVIVILFVVIFWLVYVNRKYKKSDGIYKDVKINKKKTSVEKELIQC